MRGISYIIYYRDQAKGREIKKELQDKKLVREYEDLKAKGTLRAGLDDPLESQSKYASDSELDALWQRLRYFFDDLTETGDKRVLGRRDKPNREKFLEACEEFDMEKRGILAEFLIEKSLNRCRFVPMPNKQELMKLFKALEVIEFKDDDDINYRKLLEATVKRETTSINGIFPKIVSTFPH